MDYKKLYNKLSENLSSRVCEIWPEYGIVAADWPDLAKDIVNIYKTLKCEQHSVPRTVRVGYMDESSEGMGLAQPSASIKLNIPMMYTWSSYRGLFLYTRNAKSATVSIVNQVCSSMLLRLLLHSDKGEILIHKIDPRGLGRDMGIIPQQPLAPIVIDKAGVCELVNKLRFQIANHPVAPMTWRCDACEDSFAVNTHPLQIIFVANWEDLYDIHSGKKELSDAQRGILDMLASDVPARNGIYFFICGARVYEEELISEVLPSFAIDVVSGENAGENCAYCAQLTSKIVCDKPQGGSYDIAGKVYKCRLSLPSEAEIQTLLKAYRDFLNGELTDSDGEGLWKGNSSQGIRAVMGVTPQGGNQFFELGVGQGYDAFHALIGGATGSGKSVLISEIICSLAERYSPSELRMLLLDYKEGTEFAPFAKLPHVYALSMGSNPEFGLEVLKAVQKELARRGQLFKDAGNAKNLDEYRKFSGEKLCRYVLVADEFQVLLVDKKYGEEAKTVLNDLVRRGRSFGFHAILATQTLRDGALDGEAKNQFGCRIAMRMAESETDYFLSSGNMVPASFKRKGQALVNYAMGRKESNIIFQSGNRNMPRKYRDTTEVQACVDMLHNKAVTEYSLPTDVYIYSSDGFAPMPECDGLNQQGVLIGLRNDMQSSPVMLSARQLSGKILILGDNKNKKQALLRVLSSQLSELYKESVGVQSPSDYIDYPTLRQATILEVPEGDFDFEEAILEWKARGDARPRQEELSTSVAVPPSFIAPAGMEAEFAELMQSMQNNQAAMDIMPAPPRSRRNRDSRCLVVAVSTASDLKLMEAGGMYVSDFRTIIYLDHVIYNQVSGEYENSPLGEAAAFLESPRGVVTKIRLFK